MIAIAAISGLAAQATAHGEPKLSELLLPTDAVAAIDGEYGRANVLHMANVLLKAADPACRESRKLGIEQYRAEARAMLLAYFPAVRKHEADILDSEGFKIAFDKKFGDGALAEWRTMFADPIIAKRLAIMRPSLDDNLVDKLTERISQAQAIHGYGERTEFGATVIGDADLLMLFSRLSEELEKQLKAFDAANPSPLVARFEQLMVEWVLVVIDAPDFEPSTSAWKQVSSWDLIQGLPERWEKICLRK
jgi:hypothetical protein